MRRLRRLVARRELRAEEGLLAVEGPGIIATAMAAGAEVESLYLGHGHVDELADLANAVLEAGGRCFTLAPGVLERVADTTTPQPAIALVASPVRAELPELADGVVVVAENLRDPGNAGTIIRSADALGASAVVLAGSSVDPTNPKVVRSTAGSLFHLPVVSCSVEEAFTALAAAGFTSAATRADGDGVLGEVPLPARLALWVGNEAHGLSTEVADRCELALAIPMVGQAESLNAGVATSIALYEALRQRSSQGAGRPAPTMAGVEDS